MEDDLQSGQHDLRYRGAAVEWTDALPLGNGRLAAMCFGGAVSDRIQVNESTVWSGSPRNEQAGEPVGAGTARAALAEARAAVDRADFRRADAEVQRLQHGYPQSYLPFVDLVLTTRLTGSTATAVQDHRRSLGLDTATHATSFVLDGWEVRREVFVSRRHDVLAVVTSTDAPHGLDVDLALTSPLRSLGTTGPEPAAGLLLRAPEDVAPTYESGPEPIRYSEDPTASVEAAVALRCQHDGGETRPVPAAQGVALAATGVRQLVVFLAADTTFDGVGRQPHGELDRCRRTVQERLDAAVADGIDVVRRAHRSAHAALYRRCSLTLTGAGSGGTTEERLARVQAGAAARIASDPGLAALLYNFGRYLLISSSRPGGPPPNLQGIWNEQLQPPWSSDYTININLQMNSWLAEVTGLPELTEPLFDLVDALAARGEETARRLYDAPGWVAHQCTDVWAYTQPVGDGTHDPSWAFWPLGGAWLGQHLWDHVRFGAGTAFARARAWPVLRSAAVFYLAWLVPRPDGTLGTSPSTSPENHFRCDDGAGAATTASATMDLSLIADLFRSVLGLAELLSVEDPLLPELTDALSRIPPVRTGRDGLVREWADDREAVDPQHRHLAHLYFLHPGEAPVSAELAAAAARSLDARGDDSTGWSLVWKVCMQARLRHPDRVDDLLALVFRDMATDRGPWSGGLYRNLFMAHPPFQIDGNLGYVAALTECVLQSHRGEIELLPALPRSLPDGSLRGVVARPGVTVDVEWAEGRLVRATLLARTARAAGAHRVVHRGVGVVVHVDDGRPTTVLAEQFADQFAQEAALES